MKVVAISKVIWNEPGGKFIICSVIILAAILSVLVTALAASYNKEEDTFYECY